MIYYSTVAEAEQAILDAGFTRAPPPRAVWVGPGNKTAKVMREAPGKFYVKWT